MKKCFACKRDKPLDAFYRSNVHYRQRECKECTRLRKHRWHMTESGKLSSANSKLKKRFGITLQEYEQMVAAVQGKCEICGATSSYGKHRLAVDHDHKSGLLRGILCKSCNTGLGAFRDDVTLLYSAVAYLRAKAMVAA